MNAHAPQPTIGTLVDDAMSVIERDNPSLKGVLPKDYARPGLDKLRREWHVREQREVIVAHTAGNSATSRFVAESRITPPG